MVQKLKLGDLEEENLAIDYRVIKKNTNCLNKDDFQWVSNMFKNLRHEIGKC